MAKAHDEDYEALTLANIKGGAMEEEFQERLAEVMEILADPLRYQQGAGGYLTARVSVEVEIGLHVESKTRDLTYQVSLRRPKPKRQAEQLYQRDGVFLVQPGLHQTNLLDVTEAIERKKKDS